MYFTMESVFESEVIYDQKGLHYQIDKHRTANTQVTTYTSDGSSATIVLVLKICFILLLMPISSIMGKSYLYF